MLSLALPVLLLSTAAVNAAGPALKGDPSTAGAGMRVTIQGSGFDRNEPGTLAWDGALSSTTYRANGQGTFSIAFTIPHNAVPATHEISAVASAKGADKKTGAGVVRARIGFQVASSSGSVAPSPTPTPTPTPSPTPTPTPTPSPSPACGSLQALVDAAPAGVTVTAPDCVYRETVWIKKSLTLVTHGAVIDGEGVRNFAFRVEADNVTIDGFEVTRTTNAAQHGAVHVRTSQRFTLRNVYIHHTGGACVSIAGGSGHRIVDSELAYCDQQGFHLPSITDSLIARNRIHHNNPNGTYSTGHEAGAGKISSQAARVTFEDNEVYNNVGFGLWADYARDITFRGNRAYHNTRAGIHFEISDGGLLENNVLWENGWKYTHWGWGAGIIVSSSRNVEVRNNVVAWSPDGITVLSQNRTINGVVQQVRDVYVHHNDILRQNVSDGSMIVLLGWQQDWAGIMYESASNNRGQLNRYWYPVQEPTSRFEWTSTVATLSAFNKIPGEEGGVYLTEVERNAVLAAAGIPAAVTSR